MKQREKNKRGTALQGFFWVGKHRFRALKREKKKKSLGQGARTHGKTKKKGKGKKKTGKKKDLIPRSQKGSPGGQLKTPKNAI